MSEKIVKKNLPYEHVSHSQISMYLRCGEQYRRRYIEGEKIPPGISLLKGGAIHEGIKKNNKQKITSYKDLPKNDIVDYSVSSFEDRKNKEGYILTKEEQSVGASKVIGEAKDRLAIMSGVYADEMAPAIQPKMAEETILVNMPDVPAVKMVLDCIDSDKNIRDSKLSGKKKVQKDVDTSLQLTLYAIAYRILTGELPASVCFDVLVDKSKPEYQPLLSTRTIADFNIGLHIMKSAIDGIVKGVFLSAAGGSWNCDPKFCGFHSSCRFVRKS